MANLLHVEPSDDVLAWAIFIDRRPITNFNRDFESLVTLAEGEHRLVIDADGSGATVTVTIDGATLLPEGSTWPLTLEVPGNRTGQHLVAKFSV
ncbi:hypothetical protein N6H05_14580 [Sphingobium sp. WTD-1]|jgi:hypothetical protein|uniref:hypothetical protein n=1 Tax=Sphingobium sp. WTD-1 TaxID=2979467 RepID=UPI0024DEB12D|nr:hypothetical protein [Sphingobium sp. WTD-1]WIA54289.1 hypothetical protein N6H05_14580 [Sphingobium sp. WTD-1]